MNCKMNTLGIFKHASSPCIKLKYFIIKTISVVNLKILYNTFINKRQYVDNNVNLAFINTLIHRNDNDNTTLSGVPTNLWP